MSYARWSDTSSVYVYPTETALHCCLCELLGGCWETNSIEAMTDHLHKHESAGHAVPSGAAEAVRCDREWLVSGGIAS